MRRIITRLLIAQLIPLALRYLKKAFRKKKSANLQSKVQRDNLEVSPGHEPVETLDTNVTDKGVG